VSQVPDATRIEDARLALAGRAAQGERRNRPRTVVVLAGALVLIAGVWAFTQWTQLASARAEAARERARAAAVLQLSADLSALQARAAESGPSRDTEPMTDIIARLQRFGQEFGIEVPFPSDQTLTVREGLIERRYNYTLRGHDIEPMLGWVQAAVGRIDGMRVFGFNLRVEGGRWSLIVVLSRLERTS